jgi:hypothetical protein
VTVPATFFTRLYSASASIIPTGKQDYPPTQASGMITIYNGSILSQSLPKGFIITSADGVEMITDASVIIPPGNPPAYGTATVLAHAVTGGAAGNIAPLDINQNYGGALYLRNLSPFTGGKDGYSVASTTEQNKQTARDKAASDVANAVIRTPLLVSCRSSEKVTTTVTITLSCQYVMYKKPANVQVLSEKVIGNTVVLEVRCIVQYRHPLH